MGAGSSPVDVKKIESQPLSFNIFTRQDQEKFKNYSKKLLCKLSPSIKDFPMPQSQRVNEMTVKENDIFGITYLSEYQGLYSPLYPFDA